MSASKNHDNSISSQEDVEIQSKTDENLKEDNVNKRNDNLSDFKKPEWKKTNLGKSIIFALIEVGIPGILIWLLTSKDVSFSFSAEVPVYATIILAIAGVAVSLLSTVLFWKLKLHYTDQFSYVLPLSLIVMLLYVSGLWWGADHFLYRFLFAFFVGLISSLFVAVAIAKVFQTQAKTELAIINAKKNN